MSGQHSHFGDLVKSQYDHKPSEIEPEKSKEPAEILIVDDNVLNLKASKLSYQRLLGKVKIDTANSG